MGLYVVIEYTLQCRRSDAQLLNLLLVVRIDAERLANALD